MLLYLILKNDGRNERLNMHFDSFVRAGFMCHILVNKTINKLFALLDILSVKTGT